MAALVNALDSYTPQQIGEKGHVEYGWSNNIQEKIVQFSFQLTRTDDDGQNKLSVILGELLSLLKNQIDTGTDKNIAKSYLSVLYRMIGQTRDIINGKGEYTLTYMMLQTWYEYFPNLALFALKCLVDLDNKVHPYGSWKDIKYFCKYCKSKGLELDHPLIEEAIRLTNEQLRKDVDTSEKISLVAKWIPREKSSFGWIYQALATDYFKEYMVTANSEQRHVKAVLKCKTEYRKLLSKINNKIDTLQIKQCANTWADIDFNKVTSVSLGKQKKSFLNLKKNGETRYPDSVDRLECASNFVSHIKKAVTGEVEMKGKRVGLADFTKQARIVSNQSEIDLLNSQWRDNSSQNGVLDNFVAVVDLSGSMLGDPMDVAIAMGIRIAEKSKLGKRIMTFSMNPRWINLETYPDFVSQVKKVERGDVGYNTDFYKVLNLFLDAVITNKMPPEDVQNMVIVLLSDMQIDQAEPSTSSPVSGVQKREALYQSIKSKYAEAGMRVHGKPYEPPHMLFWNLRSTSGSPSLSNEKNVSMMSGFNPTLLNLFCEKGIEGLQSCTPWTILNDSLDNDRYKVMYDYLEQNI